MTIDNQDNLCLRCHNREKLFEIFKKCSYCSTKYCQQCWIESQTSDEHKVLGETLPKTSPRRICSTCLQTLHAHVAKKKHADDEDDYQLALAISLSQKEADEQRKREEIKAPSIIEKKADQNENLLDKTAEAIERFMNRAKSNCK